MARPAATMRLVDKLAVGGELSLGDIVVGHGHTEQGVVRDDAGAAVANASFVISAHGFEGARGELADLADGTFATMTDAAGHYELHDVASMPPVDRHPQLVARTRDHRVSLPVPVPDSDAAIDLAVHPTGRLEITIAGFPHAMALVHAIASPRVMLSSDPMFGGERFTLPAGDYDVEELGLVASTRGAVQRVSIAAGSTTSLALGTPLTAVTLDLHVGPCSAVVLQAFTLSTPIRAACNGPHVRIAGVMPDRYRACLEIAGQRHSICKTIVVPPAPAVQQVDLANRP